MLGEYQAFRKRLGRVMRLNAKGGKGSKPAKGNYYATHENADRESLTNAKQGRPGAFLDVII